jgi:hypothetical protein
MGRITKVASLGGALIAVSVAAQAASLAVGKKVEVNVDPSKMDQEKAELWKRFGGFCSIKDWHPGVANCEESKEGENTIRTLTLKDGGVIKEKLIENVEGRYKYAIISGPWPVKNYEAQFALTPDDDDEDEVNIAWSAVFDADGKPDKEARALVDGVIKAGMDNIKAMTAKPSDEKDDD